MKVFSISDRAVACVKRIRASVDPDYVMQDEIERTLEDFQDATQPAKLTDQEAQTLIRVLSTGDMREDDAEVFHAAYAKYSQILERGDIGGEVWREELLCKVSGNSITVPAHKIPSTINEVENMKQNNELTPAEVKAMPLAEFEQRFGFRPVDALEKHYFAANAKRLAPNIGEALEAGVIGPISLDGVVMD